MTRFIRDDFKISFLGETYSVDEEKGTVTCTLKYRVLTPEGNFTWLRDPDDRIYRAVGIAQCSNTDKFDSSIGKMIARTKAENKAYMKTKRGIQKAIDEYTEIIKFAENFKEKADKVMAHNEDYVQRLESEIKPKKQEEVKAETVNHDKVATTPQKRTKTYVKHTPIGDITFTEKHLTNDEAKKAISDFEDKFNKMLDDFSKSFPRFF